MQLFKRYVSARGVTVFVAEILLIFGSIAVAGRLHGSFDQRDGVFWKMALVTGLCLLSLYYNDFYDLTLVHSNRELIVRLLQAAGAVSILLALLYVAVPSLELGNGTFVTSLVLFLFAILAWRLVFNRFARAQQLEERLLVVGNGTAARTLARQIGSQHDFAYRIVGFVDDQPASGAPGSGAVVGTPADIPRLVAERRVDRIVVALADRRGKLPIEELLRAKVAGVRVEDVTTTYERITGKILLDDLKPSWLVFSDGFRVSRVTRLVKRGIDILLSLAGFALSAPVMVASAAAIWIETGPPVLYRQERVGENGRMFVLFKFRSMRVDAEQGGVPLWARDRDDRITRVGRVIRKTRLDELPQLWNVLAGDMSFVGPRPERPFFVEQLTARIPFYSQRHAVKPGITGWAQVKYRYGASIEDATEKLRYDLYYIKHLSLGFDLTIVLDTVKVILFRQGAK
jgi:sugar transferase (PEP-CTERM system associated)